LIEFGFPNTNFAKGFQKYLEEKNKMLSIKNTISFVALVGGLSMSAASSVSAADVCKKVEPLPSQVGYTVYKTIFATDTPQCQAAKTAFDAAVVIVTGNPYFRFAAEKYEFSSSPYIWVNDLANNPKYSAKFNEGLKFSDAVSYLKERLTTNAADRLFAINNAFMEVYGRTSNTNEQAGWDAQVKTQKAWYAVIVTSEISKLNGNPLTRSAIINDVYQRTMGRTATPEELKYWTPRSAHFRLIVQANRNFLYSSNGAKDLTQTVRTAFSAKYKREPLPLELKTALTKAAENKLIFEEMISPGISLTK
jgi:hypothetical protein